MNNSNLNDKQENVNLNFWRNRLISYIRRSRTMNCFLPLKFKICLFLENRIDLVESYDPEQDNKHRRKIWILLVLLPESLRMWRVNCLTKWSQILYGRTECIGGKLEFCQCLTWEHGKLTALTKLNQILYARAAKTKAFPDFEYVILKRKRTPILLA